MNYMDKDEQIEEKYKEKLTPEEYAVLREGSTESPFTGEYVDMHEDGMYHCKACGAALFSSETKFDSGTGWPSFTDPASAEHVELVPDDSDGTRPPGLRPGEVGQVHRTEVRCRNCGSHLGHMFDDGPRDKGGKRFCINSCALDFKEK